MWKQVARWIVPILVASTGVLMVGYSLWNHYVGPGAADSQLVRPDYSHTATTWTGRDACVECHAVADSDWMGSDHDLAMQIPGPKTITADFNTATYTHFDVTSTFYRDGETYMVRTDGPDGVLTDYEVAYVFGYFPLEQFLIRLPGGRLQALNVCWDTTPAAEGGQRWFHLYPDDETPADDLFHWTGILQNWNFMCAECHSTNVQRHYDAEQNSYATTWSELDVACEACHGPGSRHLTWERAYEQGLDPRNDDGARGLVVRLKSPDQGQWMFEPDKPTAVRSEPLASRVEVESCARCHARRSQLTEDYQYNRPFLDHYRLTLLEEHLYHADGQNMDEVYVYGSFLQSKMYAAGVTCSDCHDAHRTTTLGEGNIICARCHRADTYDRIEHHFHQPGKGGDSCLDCHMQARKVMVVDARRDHSFRIPRPDLSLELGTPNACSDCHDDKSIEWAQQAIVDWYGENRQQGPHYATALHAGRTGTPGALDGLRALIGDPDKPGIAKATALSLTPRFAPSADVPEVVQALSNADPLVRSAAVRSLASSSPERQLQLALPLVRDSVRDVRIAAAGIIDSLPRQIADPATNPAIADAIEIWHESLRANLDRPETRLQLAASHLAHGESILAEEVLREALELAPRYVPTYVNLADLLRRERRLSEAEEILLEGIETATEPADIHHALGLLWVSMRDMPGAIAALGEAVAQREDSARFRYVYAVALHDNGQIDLSQSMLDEVLRQHPWDIDSLAALVIYSMEQNDPERALDPAERLVKLNPNDSWAQSVLSQVRAAAIR